VRPGTVQRPAAKCACGACRQLLGGGSDGGRAHQQQLPPPHLSLFWWLGSPMHIFPTGRPGQRSTGLQWRQVSVPCGRRGGMRRQAMRWLAGRSLLATAERGSLFLLVPVRLGTLVLGCSVVVISRSCQESEPAVKRQ